MFKTLAACCAALLLIVAEAAPAQAPEGAVKPPVPGTQGATSGVEASEEQAEAPTSDTKPADREAQAPGNDAKAGDGQAKASGGDAKAADGKVKSLLGISILGNKEAPKSLVIVPWKSSEIGEGLGVSRALDTSVRPVDKDVFARELEYYEIRANDGKK